GFDSAARQKDVGVADSMALLEQLLNQRRRTRAPYDVVAGADYRREVESFQPDFLRHSMNGRSRD
ncbi:MAG TPA: hypothetical protein VGA15_09615, partial [Bradyrhizobium sp.]